MLEIKPQPNKICAKCLGYGILQRNPKFKEPHGYPYMSSRIGCPECKGIGWIVSTAE